MHFRLVALVVTVVVASQVGANQTPLLAPLPDSHASYEFKWPIKKVTIIGAGPGGLVSYRELVNAGFDVRLFERDFVPGGNWHYTEEIPVDVPIPNLDISVADFTPSLPPKGAALPHVEVYHAKDSEELRRAHRGPKPIWASLHSNAPAPIQQIPEIPWPKKTSWELPHAKIQQYLRAFASFHNLNSNDGNPRVSYNTRVELVEKRYDENGKEAGWTLALKEVVLMGNHTTKAIWTTEKFDAVVIATGRYNAPNVPNIPGVAEWASRFPDRLVHSRQYRRPEEFANKTVLIVGAATSGGEISRDLNKHVRKIYQSVRPDSSPRNHPALELFLRRLPSNVTIVPEIKRFRSPTANIQDSQIELTNGNIITGIDTILFATGYRYTFPFLPEYHNSSITQPDDDLNPHPRPIVTDGTHLRALYLDLFYIEEPTPSSIYLAVALSKVWSNTARIPDTSELWKLQRERVERLGGYGKHFQFLGAEKTDVLIRFFLGWLNDGALKYGGRTVGTIDAANGSINEIWNRLRYGEILSNDRLVNSSLTTSLFKDTSLIDLIDLYNDSW